MTLQVVDAIAFVTQHPQMFFSEGKVDALRLVSCVMFDVLELGKGECRIVHRDDWWFVTSDIDWLAHDLPVAELFQRIVPAPQHGVNAMRAEVLVRAFAADVFVASGEHAGVLAGEAPAEALVRSALDSGWARGMVAFRLDRGGP